MFRLISFFFCWAFLALNFVLPGDAFSKGDSCKMLKGDVLVVTHWWVFKDKSTPAQIKALNERVKQHLENGGDVVYLTDDVHSFEKRFSGDRPTKGFIVEVLPNDPKYKGHVHMVESYSGEFLGVQSNEREKRNVDLTKNTSGIISVGGYFNGCLDTTRKDVIAQMIKNKKNVKITYYTDLIHPSNISKFLPDKCQGQNEGSLNDLLKEMSKISKMEVINYIRYYLDSSLYGPLGIKGLQKGDLHQNIGVNVELNGEFAFTYKSPSKKGPFSSYPILTINFVYDSK